VPRRAWHLRGKAVKLSSPMGGPKAAGKGAYWQEKVPEGDDSKGKDGKGKKGGKDKDGGKDVYSYKGKDKDAYKGKDGYKGKDKDKGYWKGEGGMWRSEENGSGKDYGKGKGLKGKDGKDGKGKGKKGEMEWVAKGRSDAPGPRTDREDVPDWEEEEPPQTGGDAAFAENRSVLSSSAPDFKPSGLFDYDALSQFFNWQTALVQEMPPLWREYADKDGQKYYYNSKTGLTQWERPAEMDPPPPEANLDDDEPPSKAQGSREAKSRSSAPESRSDRERNRPDRDRDRDRDDDRDARKRDEGGKGDGKSKGKDRRRQGGGVGGGKSKNAEEPSFGPPGCNLFVFHLPDDWADDELLEYFAPHGSVVSAKVMRELGTGRSRGFGFVSYEDRVSAATAIKKMQGYKILGKRLKVEFKKGEGEANREVDDRLDSEEKGADDERLIGYLRAISAKSVVQSLKENDASAEQEDAGDLDEDRD